MGEFVNSARFGDAEALDAEALYAVALDAVALDAVALDAVRLKSANHPVGCLFNSQELRFNGL